MTPELERKLRQLRLSGFVQALPVRNQEAITNHLAYVEFLELLVEDGLARRRELLFQRRMKQAQLPPPKYLDEFDWGFNPKIPKQLILDLATLRFIPEHGGALILGAAGLGKSHICVSIGVRAIEAGYTVRYRSASISPKTSLRRPPPAPAKSSSPASPPSICSSRRTAALALCRPTPPRTCWRSSPAATRPAHHPLQQPSH